MKNGKAARSGAAFRRKPTALRPRRCLLQARTSAEAGILVTDAEDRGWWLDTGSPPFSCCAEVPNVWAHRGRHKRPLASRRSAAAQAVPRRTEYAALPARRCAAARIGHD